MSTSQKCPCGPCSLCQSNSNKYTHPEKFQTEEYTFLCGVEGRVVTKTECICYPCSKQIKRNVNNKAFKPRWQHKYPRKSENKCSITSCSNMATKNTQLVSNEEIELILGHPVTSFTVDDTTSVALCLSHYNEMYTHIHPNTCESCGAYPKRGEQFKRHCPHPESINTYLTIVSSDPSHLTEQSIICGTCYKHFKYVQENIERGKVTTPNLSKVSQTQRDSEIDTVIYTLSSKMTNIFEKRKSATLIEYKEYIACVICKRVGERMKADEAMLLPTLHKEFIHEFYSNTASFRNSSHVSENDIPNSRWLLSQLYLYFESKIVVQCHQRRYGTLIYHKNCDLIHALTTALGKGEIYRQATCTCTHSCTCTCSNQQQIAPDLKGQTHEVALYLNSKLHERARVLKDSFDVKPESIASADFAEVLANTDPDLMAFLSTMTQSVRQSKRKLFADTTVDLSKNIRLFYALCVLQFCTNSTCSAPLHLLLTEAVLCHGGTLELVQILNRLGAVASLDTVNRLATHVVQKRLSTGVKSDLQPRKFSVISIDNIDILQPFSFVSSLDSTRSWHGTSVQCVQPHPVSGHLTPDDILSSTSMESNNSKRERSSPANTPVPIEKQKRRKRTLTEHVSPHSTMVLPSQDHITSNSSPFYPTEYGNHSRTLHLDDFRPNAIEQSVLDRMQSDLFHCVLLRKFGSTESTQAFSGLQSFINCIRRQSTDSEVSNVTYVEILSQKADSKPTLLNVIGRLQRVFVQELKQKYVLVVGDAKTYNLLQAICYEYKAHLPWLLPFPGDWHVLFNYQKALMKPYADAGLASLGKAAGHRAETLTSLLNASNFRRTHEFLLQAFEALYRYFLSLFVSYIAKNKGIPVEERSVVEDISSHISSLVHQFAGITSNNELDSFRQKVNEVLSASLVKYNEFKSYMERLSTENDTVKFWYRFVSVDCFAYIALFMSLRYRNWELRTGSFKVLAAIFSAFDRPIYQEVTPRHLKELLLMPAHILHHLQKGSFSVRLSATEWHGVAIDECHEMKINKDAKLAVVHPSQHRMEFLSNYLSFRSACVENLKKMLFPEREVSRQTFSHSPTSKDKKRETNILTMLEAIQNKDMLSLSGLWNFLEEKEATPEQAYDLLNFRSIGQEAFERFVSCKVLGLPSTSAPTRRKKLTTFSVTKTQKQRIKLVEKERKISQRYLKQQLAWISEQGTKGLDFDSLLGPISSLPRALIGKDGLPYKATKSSTTEYLRKRYSAVPIIMENPPPQWTPHTAILEGMFLIQSTPLSSMSCMKEYAQWLLDQYVKPHLKAGVQEVHVAFDSPGAMKETPKELEQRRRDKNVDKHHDTHKCAQITSSTAVPSNWRALLSCRKCKHFLTQYVAQEMLTLTPNMLRRTQMFASNVGETTHSVTSSGEMLPCPQLWCNADEADLRVWLHCIHSTGTQKFLFSPDTDVFHIGLTVLPLVSGGEVVVQLSRSFKDGSKFLFLHRLLDALQNDPDLHGIPSQVRPQVLQSLYVCTGCDYVSFFVGMGKVSFLSSFFQYASFIAGGSEPPGSIGEVSLDRDSPSCLSFFRLVGCTYFRAHASAFEFTSPVTLYNSIMASNVYEKHDKWLHSIRKAVWLRADTESKNMPSTTALKLHWIRCLWIIAMWHKSTENDIDMPGMEDFGWTRQSGHLEVVWESEENQEKAKDKIEYILKGCKCSKTGCCNKKCKCKKSERFCGPGCRCVNCTNIPGGRQEWDEEVNDLELQGQEDICEGEEEYVDESENEELDEEMYNDEETNEIMTSVFGEEDLVDD